MAMLKILSRRPPCRPRWIVAPNASHTKPLGNAASEKRAPMRAAWTNTPARYRALRAGGRRLDSVADGPVECRA